MAIAAITIPKWGMTMTEGKLVQWLVALGDRVACGQEVMEVESTKTVSAVQSPASGVLRRIVVSEGETAAVGALVAVLADVSDSEEDIDAFVKKFDSIAVQETGNAGHRVISMQPIDVGDGAVVNVLTMGPQTEHMAVLLHGFGGDQSSWMLNQDALAEQLRVLAVDLPGHGASTPVRQGDVLQHMVDAVEKAVDAQGASRLHLVAHSFGGVIAAALAARKGATVASMTLIAPVGFGAGINIQFLEDFVAADRRRPLKIVLEQLFADPSKASHEMVENILRYKRLDGIAEALTMIKQCIIDMQDPARFIHAALHGANAPVQLIWGEHDKIIPVPHRKSIAENVALTTIKHVGHMPHIEAADAINRLVLENIGKAM